MKKVKTKKGYTIYENSTTEILEYLKINIPKEKYEVYLPDESPRDGDKPDFECSSLLVCKIYIDGCGKPDDEDDWSEDD